MLGVDVIKQLHMPSLCFDSCIQLLLGSLSAVRYVELVFQLIHTLFIHLLSYLYIIL